MLIASHVKSQCHSQSCLLKLRFYRNLDKIFDAQDIFKYMIIEKCNDVVFKNVLICDDSSTVLSKRGPSILFKRLNCVAN